MSIGNVLYIRADRIDYDNLINLDNSNDYCDKINARYLRIIMPMKINDMAILAHITNVHDYINKKNKYYLDDKVLELLLTNKYTNLSLIVPESIDELESDFRDLLSKPTQLILDKRPIINTSGTFKNIQIRDKPLINVINILYKILGNEYELSQEFFKN